MRNTGDQNHDRRQPSLPNQRFLPEAGHETPFTPIIAASRSLSKVEYGG